MRAAIMRNATMVVDELPEPEPGPGQVLVKTLACGICGSDLHLFGLGREQPAGEAMPSAPDLVMGHEFCVEILDYGPDTERRFKPGARVCSLPVTIAGGQPQMVGLTSETVGGYAERMLLSESMLLPVPEGLPTELAALTEPMAVGFHAVAKARLGKEDVPLVIGCGPVGLAVIQALKLAGRGPVVAADFSPSRRRIAEALGADIVVDPAQQSPYRTWADICAPQGYDPSPLAAMMGGPSVRPGVVFECVGVPGIIAGIMAEAMRNTRILVVGVCMQSDHFEPWQGINLELSIQFAMAYTFEEFATTLHSIADGRIDPSPMITSRVGVTEVPRAFAELGSPATEAKILIESWS